MKASTALNCHVNSYSTFDRKHYFYGDQPAGYQITQHYNPIATNGKVQLFKHDGAKTPFDVGIIQVQIEQDTGKSVYFEKPSSDINGHDEKMSKIDLNRTNTPLIEIVTAPDIPDPQSAKNFVRKLQTLLRHIGVCTGDMETGAMRVDVNVSVNGGERCEIKNLANTSSVSNSIKYEFQRQSKLLSEGKTIERETRGWDGKVTTKLRGKEDAVDYRYMPDPELEPIILEHDVVSKVKDSLPELPDSILQRLLTKPYNLQLKPAKTLMQDPSLVKYYFNLYDYTVTKRGVKPNAPGNWLVHEFLGALGKKNMEFDSNIFPMSKLGDLIVEVHNKSITITTAKLLLLHLLNNQADLQKPISDVIKEYNLGSTETMDSSSSTELDEAVQNIAKDVLSQHEKIKLQIQSGEKPNAIRFLVGQAMKASQGRVDAHLFETALLALIHGKS